MVLDGGMSGFGGGGGGGFNDDIWYWRVPCSAWFAMRPCVGVHAFVCHGSLRMVDENKTHPCEQNHPGCAPGILW